MNANLRDILPMHLEAIDEILATQEVPLKRRPLRAAMLFVREVVLEVEGGSKDDPIGQPWFEAIQVEVSQWYRQRYGKAVSSNTEGVARAFVVLLGAPLRLTIPLTVSRDGNLPYTRRLHFPVEVRSDEDPFSFLEEHIGVETLSAAAGDALRADIGAVVCQTRSLCLDLRTAALPDRGKRLAERVLWALSQSVDSVTDDALERRALAVWELNLVAELALKAFLVQRGESPKRVHDVRQLYDAAVTSGLPCLDNATIGTFPDKNAAIRYRYGESRAPNLDALVALYESALSVAGHCALQLEHPFRMRNAWIEIRIPGSRARLPGARSG